MYNFYLKSVRGSLLECLHGKHLQFIHSCIIPINRSWLVAGNGCSVSIINVFYVISINTQIMIIIHRVYEFFKCFDV